MADQGGGKPLDAIVAGTEAKLINQVLVDCGEVAPPSSTVNLATL